MRSSFEPGFVKICGVTSVEDGLFVATSGATAIGLNLAHPSPRRVTLERARAIAAATKGSLLRCAVFRGRDDDAIVADLVDLDVDAVQLHDELSTSLLDELRDRSFVVIKALNVEGADFASFDDSRVDAVLVDGPNPGSGVEHSWSRLRERHFSVPVIAAGGLAPSNVAAVISSTTVSGVDCASGVERAVGEKDHAAVDSFVTNARRAFALREE